MEKNSRLGIIYFLILFFIVSIPKIITHLAFVAGVEIPPIIILFLFPLIAFLPPMFAVFFSMRIEKPQISFIFCFSSIIAGAFVHEVLTYGPTGLVRIPPLRSLMLWVSGSIGLGFLGAGASLSRVRHKSGLFFFGIGMIFWIVMVGEGIYRWLSIIFQML